jgi:hypothetical protein
LLQYLFLLISVASQEKKSQIETLATDSAIPGLLLSGKLPQQAYEKIKA